MSIRPPLHCYLCRVKSQMALPGFGKDSELPSERLGASGSRRPQVRKSEPTSSSNAEPVSNFSKFSRHSLFSHPLHRLPNRNFINTREFGSEKTTRRREKHGLRECPSPFLSHFRTSINPILCQTKYQRCLDRNCHYANAALHYCFSPLTSCLSTNTFS